MSGFEAFGPGSAKGSGCTVHGASFRDLELRDLSRPWSWGLSSFRAQILKSFVSFAGLVSCIFDPTGHSVQAYPNAKSKLLKGRSPKSKNPESQNSEPLPDQTLETYFIKLLTSVKN